MPRKLLYITLTVSALAISTSWASDPFANNNNAQTASEQYNFPADCLAIQPDFQSLETMYPEHFRGFSATSMDVVKVLRGSNNKLAHMFRPLPELRLEFQDISKKLGQYGDTYVTIIDEINKHLTKNTDPNTMEYIIVLFRIALFQGKGTQDEALFFTAAGHSNPYKTIFLLDLQKDSSEQDFITKFLELMNSESDGEGDDYDYISSRSYFDNDDIVEKEFVKKGLFSSTILPLVDEDVLGFFYLAWTFSQGIHPLPFPLLDNQSNLHGIAMSRFAKTCHDLAHSERDAADHSAEQFADFLISHHLNIIRPYLPLMSPEIRKHFSFKSIAPIYAGFAMKVHNLYHQSLIDILKLCLYDMDPRNELNLDAFKAFSVGAYLQAHEEPEDLSGTYGTPVLTEILKAFIDPISKVKSDDAENADQQPVSLADPYFKTSFLNDGISPLTDEQIFEIVKDMNKSDFISSNRYYGGPEKLDANEIADYEVKRNKFFIEVRINMFNGDIFKFRQNTNYSSQLNIDHDLKIVTAGSAILKNEYNYELPVAPKRTDFEREDSYTVAASKCINQLDIGQNYLLDYWLKNATRLSQIPIGETASIAERFSLEYNAALDALKSALLPENVQSYLLQMPQHPPLFDLKQFIKDAQKPGAVYAYHSLPLKNEQADVNN